MQDLVLPPPEIPYTLEALEKHFSEVLIMADKGVLRLCIYCVVANKMKLGPVWVCIVAPPSGGKSELLQSMFDLVDYVHPLSSLTPQTLISGMKQANGKSASLLDDLIGKTVIMKDLTTIVEMGRDEQREILAQMREVYDKRFDKAFGTGERKQWEGHVGWLGAITHEGRVQFGSRAAMGERFIFYVMKMPDRMEVLRKSAQNQANNMEMMQLRLKACMNRFLEPILKAAEGITDKERKVVLDAVTQNKVFTLAEFTTRARSAVDTHWKTGEVEYVHPPEMPTRFANQLTGVAGAALFIYKVLGENIEGIKDVDMNILADICWGSIPSKRAKVISQLAKYKQATTKAIGASLGYETTTVRGWLLELAGLKIVKRRASVGGGGGDIWYMNDHDRDLVCDYSGFKKLMTELADEDPDEEEFDPNDPDVLAMVEQAKSIKQDEFAGIDPHTGQLIGSDIPDEDF